MSGETLKCKAGRGLNSIETWLILLLIVISGMSLGYPLGQYEARRQANIQIAEMRAAYAEATQAKADLLRRCIFQMGDE
jgi:hypothetical protein